MKLLILVTAFVFAPLVLPHKFPDKFNRCHRSDADLDNCLKSTIDNAFHLIGTIGISSLNLPSIDPLLITRVEIGAGTSAVNLVQKYSDVKLIGFAKSTVESAHLDLDKKELTFTMNVPKVEQKAKYEIDGKILVMPVFGKGDSIITLNDVTFVHTLTFEEVTQDNEPYFKVKTYKLSVTPKGAHFEFKNLFNGDEALSANIHKVVNDNWQEIFDDVKSGLEASFSEVFKSVANNLFSKISVNEIFLI